MKHFILFIITLWGTSIYAKGFENLNKDGVILSGYDAVSYFSGSTPLKGSSQYQVKENDVIYYFANEKNKSAFEKDPKKYEPQFGGWCAYAVADSKSKVDVDPKSFLIQDGRLLLFYNGIWGNTHDKWLHTKDKDSKTFLKQADSNWPETEKTEP